MATIKDIAKMAGVSTATVSRIINGKGEAKKETIERVMKLVDELDYQPNRLAKSLSQGKSDLIGIMVPNLKNPFFGELVTCIEETATKYGLQILLCDTNDSREKVEYFLDAIADNYAFGAVICTLQVTEKDLEKLQNRGVHTVTVDRSYFNHAYSSVNINQLNGAFLATNHLIDAGARDILFVTGPDDDVLSIEREKGYRMALKSRKLAENHILYGDYSLESGFKLMKKAIREFAKIDGVYAANDLMAIGALRACLDLNISVPEEIKIIGNDNLMIDDYIEPKLTSISQKNEVVSELVIKELLALRNDNAKPKKQMLEPTLVIRKTT